MAMTEEARTVYRLAHWLSIKVLCTLCQCSGYVSIIPSSFANSVGIIVVVDSIQELDEASKIRAHLKYQLAQTHLLRSSEPVESAAIGSRVVDRLDRRNPQQPGRLFVCELRRQRATKDFSAIRFRRPGCNIAIELGENALQPLRRQTGRLPKLRRGRLHKSVWIESIALRVFHCRHIEAEPGADQWPLRIRVRIGGQHPPLMLMVAQHFHQAFQRELDVGLLEREQGLRTVLRLLGRAPYHRESGRQILCGSGSRNARRDGQ